jgi:hypothetical protein
LAKLDDRVEAHLDGLRIASEPGWKLYKAALGDAESGEVFAASVMAFESGVESRIQAVLDAVAAKPGLLPGVVSTLGWLPFDQASPHVRRFHLSEVHLHRQVGVKESDDGSFRMSRPVTPKQMAIAIFQPSH